MSVTLSRQKGFSMVEVLLAMMLLVVVVTALSGYHRALAARYAALPVGVTAASPPWWGITFTVTHGGAIFLKWSTNSCVMASLFWSGTKRMLILALALDGSTVLAPSPM